jgi:hypothetical protein
MRQLILTLIILIGMVGTGEAGIGPYYVRTDGNDNCTGLVDDASSNINTNCAYKTIEKACTTGDSTNSIINVKAGTFVQAVGAICSLTHNGTTLNGGHGGGTTIWDFSTTGSGDGSNHVFNSGTGFVMQGFTLRGEYATGKVQVYANKGGTFYNNIFQDSATGLLCNGTGTCLVYNNQFLGSKYTGSANFSLYIRGSGGTGGVV